MSPILNLPPKEKLSRTQSKITKLSPKTLKMKRSKNSQNSKMASSKCSRSKDNPRETPSIR